MAVIIGLDRAELSRIVTGARAISPSLALLLEEALGIVADDLMMAQVRHDLAKARLSAIPDPERAKRMRLFGGLPVAEMMRRGWILVDDVRDVAAVESALVRFFECDSVDKLVDLLSARTS